MENLTLAKQLYRAAIESHKGAVAYLTGNATGVNVYDCQGDSDFARALAMGCMKNATSARKMLAVVKARKGNEHGTI